ncbi:hypothetical protein GK1456 [Geobacillus kaustophilus HTA426]|uniref:Lipoprotein n=1 Tax=Geobacillus kaustophilus (strain HTA426) TaxID=235909 RepID=Q5KZZ5_GEOKA|nr:hypothetical protein GK1456 [Geobacillus kaustophilus HTA426]
MKRSTFITACVLSFSVLLSSCTDDGVQEQSHSQMTKTATGDIRETTKSIEHLPSFLSAFEEEMAALYQQAAEHRELLENIPCYCGCGQSAGHKNNYDCFVYKIKKTARSSGMIMRPNAASASTSPLNRSPLTIKGNRSKTFGI